jgi:hypothetical protein
LVFSRRIAKRYQPLRDEATTFDATCPGLGRSFPGRRTAFIPRTAVSASGSSHRHAKITETYAEQDRDLSRQIMGKIG